MAILIGAVMQFLEVLNGSDPITSYCETMFREAGSALSPALSTVVLGVVLLIGTYISSILVDKAGRRVSMTPAATKTS
jgi:Sugar (and other) transporter